MEVKKQHEPKNCFETKEHLSIQEADFIGASSLEHVLQLYLIDSFSIWQNLA